MTDILGKAQMGDVQAIQSLLVKYQNLLKHVSRQHHLESIQDDAYAEAVVSFYQAIRDFDDSLGVNFAGFAKMRVYQGVHDLFRKNLRIWQHELSLSGKSTDSENQDSSDDSEDDFADLIADKENFAQVVDLKLDLSRVVKKLPQKQYWVFILASKYEFKQKQIAKILNISEQAVSKNYRKAKNFVHQALIEGGAYAEYL